MEKMGQLDTLLQLNKVIHERARLGIMAALSVTQQLTFQELKHTLNITDGNLSVHLRLLEKHKYLVSEKKFVGRKPCSSYRLSAAGKEALKSYVQRLEQLINDIQVD